MTSTPPTRPAVYRERLWPSPAFWGASPLLGVMVMISLLPVGREIAIVAALAVAAIVVAALTRLSPVVEVTADGELRAGPARIALWLLAGARGGRREQARLMRGPQMDARSHRCLRGWVDGVVVVDLADPEDPTPSWVISTRHPEQLVAAITGSGRPPREAGEAGDGIADGVTGAP